jgi:hypothetical protein
MQEEVMSHKVNCWKKILFVPALGVFLLVGGVARTQASDNDRHCDQRIHKAEEQLRKAVDKHGEHSRQAFAAATSIGTRSAVLISTMPTVSNRSADLSCRSAVFHARQRSGVGVIRGSKVAPTSALPWREVSATLA